MIALEHRAQWAERAALLRAEVDRLLAAGVTDRMVAVRCALAREVMFAALGRAAREHGSERGYRQHRTDDTPACPPCAAAHAARNAVRRMTA